MNWKSITTMPLARTVLVGNAHWASTATRHRDRNQDADWIDLRGEEIPMEETTATHWCEYIVPEQA